MAGAPPARHRAASRGACSQAESSPSIVQVRYHPGMQLRPAQASDIPAILAIQREAPTLSQWSQSLYEEIFVAGSKRIALVVENTAVEAFLVARQLGEEWEIENIAVAARARRMGAATILLAEIILQARFRGARSIFLEVRESNYPARRLYEKENFAVAGRRPAYYTAPVEDAIVRPATGVSRNPRYAPVPNEPSGSGTVAWRTGSSARRNSDSVACSRSV